MKHVLRLKGQKSGYIFSFIANAVLFDSKEEAEQFKVERDKENEYEVIELIIAFKDQLKTDLISISEENFELHKKYNASETRMAEMETAITNLEAQNLYLNKLLDGILNNLIEEGE